MAPFDDLAVAPASKELKFATAYQDNMNPVATGFNAAGPETLMLDPEDAFVDLPEANFGLRHRS